jgi:putative sigma-54 modulation protein
MTRKSKNRKERDMDVNFTARRFKAHSDMKDYAFEEVRKLQKFYDGITKADVILSYERGVNSIKTAEVNLHVHAHMLSAKETSDDFVKSLDAAVQKVTTQLRKYKSKLREKDKTKVRKLVREKV